METLVTQLRAAKKAAGYTAVPLKLAGLLGDAASRIEDLEDHVLRLEDRIATLEHDLRGAVERAETMLRAGMHPADRALDETLLGQLAALRGRPHRDG